MVEKVNFTGQLLCFDVFKIMTNLQNKTEIRYSSLKFLGLNWKKMPSFDKTIIITFL